MIFSLLVESDVDYRYRSRSFPLALRFSPPEGDDELARAMTEVIWRSLYVQAAEPG